MGLQGAQEMFGLDKKFIEIERLKDKCVGAGPENIRIALDVLGAERIDHGVAITDDPELVRRAAGERIPLTVCPTSNVVIANRYRSLGEHPLLELRAAGIPVTINTDDPAMEDLDLGREYRGVADAHNLTTADMERMAIEGIESTWLDETDRRDLRTDFEAAISGARRGPDASRSA